MHERVFNLPLHMMAMKHFLRRRISYCITRLYVFLAFVFEWRLFSFAGCFHFVKGRNSRAKHKRWKFQGQTMAWHGERETKGKLKLRRENLNLVRLTKLFFYTQISLVMPKWKCLNCAFSYIHLSRRAFSSFFAID